MAQLTILSRDASDYAQRIAALQLTGLSLASAATDPRAVDPDTIEILLADPDLAAAVIDDCTQLVWLQSTWAGVTPLIEARHRDYVLTGVKGVFDALMREYVGAYLLHFARAIDDFHPRMGKPGAQRPLRWQPPRVQTLSGKRLGVLGAGSIGSALIPLGRLFGMTVVGLTRSGTGDPDFDALYDPDERADFARDLDYLVCLLPDTASTRAFIDAEFLLQLPAHCVLINTGRGSAVDDAALLAALDAGQLRAAVLDVFVEEPLPEGHPFWRHPRVWVTQHTAAISHPQAIVDVFADNYRRWLAGEPLAAQIDFARGY